MVVQPSLHFPNLGLGKRMYFILINQFGTTRSNNLDFGTVFLIHFHTQMDLSREKSERKNFERL